MFYTTGSLNKQTSQMVSNITSLESLATALHNESLQLHTNGTNIYRLLPKNGLTEEGKRCLNSENCNFARAESIKQHPDMYFANATINYLEELAGILGPREVSFLSQDNSYRVPIGLALSNVDQSPLLMHIEQKDSLLDDEDYVTPPAHKLILSVTGAMKIKENCFSNSLSGSSVTNVGSTYIAIRTAERQPPVAFQKLRDMTLIRQVTLKLIFLSLIQISLTY